MRCLDRRGAGISEIREMPLIPFKEIDVLTDMKVRTPFEVTAKNEMKERICIRMMIKTVGLPGRGKFKEVITM